VTTSTNDLDKLLEKMGKSKSELLVDLAGKMIAQFLIGLTLTILSVAIIRYLACELWRPIEIGFWTMVWYAWLIRLVIRSTIGNTQRGVK